MVKIKKSSSIIIVLLIILVLSTSTSWANENIDEDDILSESQIMDTKINEKEVSVSEESYTSLNNLIKDNNLVELDKNHKYDENSDSKLKEGIKIDKQVVIEGNGHTIDSTNQSKLFTISKNGSLTLNNIILLNNNPSSNSGIMNLGNLIFNNVTFISQKQGNAGVFDAAIVNEGNFSINNSAFENSSIKFNVESSIFYSGLFFKNLGNLTIENTNILNNYIESEAPISQIRGGIIYNSGNLKLNNVNMSNNTGKFRGMTLTFFGFILNSEKSDIIVNNSHFENNAIINDGVKSFVAPTNVIRIIDSNASVSNSKFINNSGSINAGGIGYYNNEKIMLIENCLFDSNTVETQGGAIFVEGNVNSNNNTYRNNFAGRNGGAVYVYGYYDAGSTLLGNFVSTNDLFEYNSVKSIPDPDGEARTLSWGGAICSKAGSLTIINDTFYRNIAIWGDGGAIANYLSSSLIVSHCIFKENEATVWGSWTHASSLGGAILLPETEMYDENHPATFTVEYSIFDNNIANGGTALYSVPYKDVPCDFVSNNNYWGSNDPFFKELIGKYQSSSLVFPDNYIIMGIEGDNVIHVGDTITYKLTLNKISENGVINDLNDTLPDYEFTIDSSLNPLSNNKILFKNGEAYFTYTAVKDGLETFFINNRSFKTQINIVKYDLSANASYIDDLKLINITLSENINGNISIKVNNTEYNASIENGSAIVNVSNLVPGTNLITISYNGDEKYNEFSIDKNITIEKYMPPIEVNNMTMNSSSNSEITLQFPSDATGRVLFDIDGKLFYTNILDGVATLDISSIELGPHNIIWNYLGDEKYNKLEGNFSINLTTNEKITNNQNIQVFYTDGSKYKVRIMGTDGKAVGPGNLVTFIIGGKSIKVKTDENGYASFKITQTPKKYTVTTKYNNIQVKNTITVKNVLIAKNLSVKKAKKIKYSVTVKGKKAFAYKKVTFKLKGKTYTAKTNKKGVATIYLKNLKVGKYNIVVKYANTKLTKAIKIKR